MGFVIVSPTMEVIKVLNVGLLMKKDYLIVLLLVVYLLDFKFLSCVYSCPLPISFFIVVVIYLSI